MKYLTFCLLLLVIIQFQLKSQTGASCNIAEPFCTGVTYAYPMGTNVSAETGPNYACLYSQPNPYWYYFRVQDSGDITISMSSPTGNDVDFACWGPFTSPTTPCTALLTANCTSCPNNTSLAWPNTTYPSGNLIDCSYDPAPNETVHISNTLVGQYYILMITNYSNSPGNIEFSQSNAIGTPGIDYGTADCSFYTLCNITSLTIDTTFCDGVNNHSVSGIVGYLNPPANGTLIVEHIPSGITQVYTSPFSSPLSYSLTGIPITGANHSIKAYFSLAPLCQKIQAYTKPATPTLSFNHVKPSCGQSNGAVIVTITGGTAPYTYQWSNGQTTTGSSNSTNLLNNVPSGLYSVTVTTSGCGVSDSMLLTDNNAAEVSLSLTNNVSCHNQCNGSLTATVSLQSSPPYSYYWSGGQSELSTNATTNTQTGLCAGNYTVTLTNSGGCQSIAQLSLPNPMQLTGVLQVIQPSCTSNNGQITAIPSGGVGPYTYYWSTSQTGQTIYSLGAGSYSVTIQDSYSCQLVLSTNLITPNSVSITTSHTDNVCYEGQNGTATATVTAGVAPFTYYWNTNPPQNTATATGLAAGTYMVTVTSSNGCTTNGLTNVGQPLAPINIQVTVDQNVSCYGNLDGQVSATATNGVPPYEFYWPGNITGSSATLGAGTFVVTVSDAANCTNTVTFTITQPQQLVLSPLQVNPDCGQSNGSAIIAVATGGIAPYSYYWSTGLNQINTSSTASVLSDISAGSYTVTVVNSTGCSQTHSFIITNAGAPSISMSVVSPILCNGVCNASLEAMLSGTLNPPFQYFWSTGIDHSAYSQISDTLHNLCSGNYLITVTDNVGCVTVASYVINEPVLFTSQIVVTNPVSCYGMCNAALMVSTGGDNTGPISYLWMPGALTSDSVYGFCADTVSVIVTNGNGCASSSTMIIPQPDVFSVNTTSTDNLCAGSANGTATAVMTGGTAPFQFYWNSTPPQFTETVVGLSSGTYTVIVTDLHGCTSSSQATVSNQPAVPIVLNIVNIQDNSCFGESEGSAMVSTSGGTPPYTYLWNSTPPQPSFYAHNLPAGTYTITVTDNLGCTSSIDAVVSEPAQVVSSFVFGTNQGTVIFINQSSPGTYYWNFSDGSSSTITSPVHDYFISGNYNVCLTVYDICDTVTSCQEVPVIIVNSSLIASETFSVYPNPAQSVLFIETGTKWHSEYSLKLYDKLGRVLCSKTFSGSQSSIDVSLLPAGMYFLMINEKVVKVVIEK